MKNRIPHISTLLILAGAVSIFSGCQNRNGILGSDNWNRNGYGNYLNGATGNGTNRFYNSDGSLGFSGQAVAYLTFNQGGGASTQSPTVYNPSAGGVQTSTGTQGQTGGVAGGVAGSTTGTSCLLKIASITPGGYSNGYGYPNSGALLVPTGGKFPVPCDRNSEVAATANAFYSTGGLGSQFLNVYRTDATGATFGAPQTIAVGPNTQVAASPSGHIAVVTNGGHTLTLLFEARSDNFGGRIADKYHEIPYPNETIQDVIIDDRQGGLYVGTKFPDGAGRVYIYNLHEAFNGRYIPFMDSRAYHNYAFNFSDETAADFLFRSVNPVKLKNYDGLTGMFMSNGKPMFMKTMLSLDSSALEAKTPEEQTDIFQSQRDDAIVSEIRIFDPFQLSHMSSPYTQVSNSYNQYKDFEVGNNVAFLLTNNDVQTIQINEERPMDANTPWVNRLNRGSLTSLVMTYDRKYLIVNGINGLSAARIDGGNAIFSTQNVHDIQDGEVISSAGLAKIYKQPVVTTASPLTDGKTSTTK